MIEYLAPSMLLPTGLGVTPGITLASTEAILATDAAEHTSEEVFIPHYGRKTIHVLATEVVPVAGGQPLNIWVELSIYPTANSNEWPAPSPISALYWAAIGGGGGPLAPIAPLIIPALGINLQQHTLVFDFEMHSPFARVIAQTPVAHATSSWLVQVFMTAKGL